MIMKNSQESNIDDIVEKCLEAISSKSKKAEEYLKKAVVKSYVKDFTHYLNSQLPEQRVIAFSRAKSASSLDNDTLRIDISYNSSYLEDPDIPLDVITTHEILHGLVNNLSKWYRACIKFKPCNKLKGASISDIGLNLRYLGLEEEFLDKEVPYSAAVVCIDNEIENGKEFVEKMKEIDITRCSLTLDLFIDFETVVNDLTFAIMREKFDQCWNVYLKELCKNLERISNLENIQYEIKENNGVLYVEAESEDAKKLDGLFRRVLKGVAYLYGMYVSTLAKSFEEEFERYVLDERCRKNFIKERVVPSYSKFKSYIERLWEE
jgi:hypothetical protein